MTNIRKILYINGCHYLIGRGEANLVVIRGDIETGECITPASEDYTSLIDIIIEEEDIYLLLKEQDRLLNMKLDHI